MQEMMDAYRRYDFRAVMAASREFITQEPDNALAYYYLGNACSYLHHFDSARESYRLCVGLTKDAKIKGYAEEALRAMHQPVQAATPRAVIAPSQPPGPSEIAPEPEKPAAGTLAAAERQRDERLVLMQNEFDAQLLKINNTVSEDIARATNQAKMNTNSADKGPTHNKFSWMKVGPDWRSGAKSQHGHVVRIAHTHVFRSRSGADKECASKSSPFQAAVKTVNRFIAIVEVITRC
jgi:hypothetical protein